MGERVVVQELLHGARGEPRPRGTEQQEVARGHLGLLARLQLPSEEERDQNQAQDIDAGGEDAAERGALPVAEVFGKRDSVKC